MVDKCGNSQNPEEDAVEAIQQTYAFRASKQQK
jgi:hypothetical protein